MGSSRDSHADDGQTEVEYNHGPAKTPPAPAIASHTAPAKLDPTTAVWVLLGRIVIPDPVTDRAIDDGLDYTGRARGVLKTNTWFRSSRGIWLAEVTYQVRHADRRPRPRLFADQVVPAYALEKRYDNRPLGGPLG